MYKGQYQRHTVAYPAHHQLKYNLLAAQKQQPRATQKSLPFGKWRTIGEKKSQENGPKAKKDKTERATGL